MCFGKKRRMFPFFVQKVSQMKTLLEIPYLVLNTGYFKKNFSVRFFQSTRLGKHINELRRKAADKNLANRAKSLVKKWRSLFSAGGDTAGPPPGGGNNNCLAAANGNTSAVAARLGPAAAGTILSPGLRPANNISPGLPPPQRGSIISPALPPQQHHHQRSIISPGLPPQQRSIISPGLPPVRSSSSSASALSPPMRPHSNQSSSSTISPGLPVSSAVRSSVAAAGNNVLMNAAAIAMAGAGGGAGRRSARPSPSVSRSATPRVSPATVTLSSSGSSPSNSRPSSPCANNAAAFRPLNVIGSGGEITPMTTSLPNSRSPSPEIEIIEEVVNTPRLVINNKRMRRREDSSDDVRVVGEAAAQPAAKRPRLDFQNQNHTKQPGQQRTVVNGGHDGPHQGKEARDGVLQAKSDTSNKIPPASQSISSPQRRKKGGGGQLPSQSSTAKQLNTSMLNKQISMAQRAGKVKTTRELIENLGIDTTVAAAAASRQSSLSPPAAAGAGATASSAATPITSLVPSENKEELMKRFFESQQQQRSGGGSSSAPPSRPGSAGAAAAHPATSSSATVSQASSRVPTPQPLAATSSFSTASTVEDILATLPPIEDPAAVLAEWAARAEEEEEIEGLIPVYRPPRLEVTADVVAALNGDKNEGGGGGGSIAEDGRRLMEHVGGVTDYAGVFREWHEMVARPRDSGEDGVKKEAATTDNLLHILPYSLIDY
jgi:hypothetical protein